MSKSRRLAVASLVCFFLIGCRGEPTPEELVFRKLAREVKVGFTSDQLRRQLGEPPQVIGANEQCKAVGGTQGWLYDSIATNNNRRRLEGGAILFCLHTKGRIVGIQEIVH